MTDKPPIRPGSHDIPDDDSGPDTPQNVDDPDTDESRFLSPGDQPAEGRRDVGNGKNQTNGEAL